jgi:hypothetical protein
LQGTLNTRWLLLAFAFALVCAMLFWASTLSPFGAGEAGAQDGGAETPPYEVLDRHDAPGVRALVVASPETREAGMRLVSEDLRDDNTPENGVLLVEFRAEDAPDESTGFALVFDSESAILDSAIKDRYDEDDAREILEEEDGIRAVSFEEFAEENPTLWEKATSFLG